MGDQGRPFHSCALCAPSLPSPALSCSASDDEDGGWQHVRGNGAVQGALPGQYKSIFNNFQCTEEEWNEEDIQV